jgi:hypothetical protein
MQLASPGFLSLRLWLWHQTRLFAAKNRPVLDHRLFLDTLLATDWRQIIEKPVAGLAEHNFSGLTPELRAEIEPIWS